MVTRGRQVQRAPPSLAPRRFQFRSVVQELQHALEVPAPGGAMQRGGAERLPGGWGVNTWCGVAQGGSSIG